MAETAEVTERIQILLDLQKEAHDKAARASAREIVKLEKSYDPLSRATVKYKQETDKLTTALQKGTITEQRHVQLMDKVQAEYDQTTAKVIRQNAALSANQAATGGVVASLNRNRAAVQMLGYQVGDFAVQVGNGTSAVTAFAQQGSQMAGVFGPMGAVLGAVIAIAAPLAMSLASSGESAESMADQVEGLKTAVDDYVSAVNDAGMPTVEIAEKYGQAADAARSFLDALEEIAGVKAVEALNQMVSRLSETFGGFDDVARGPMQMNQGWTEMSKTLDAMSDTLGITVDQAGDLVEYFQALSEADGAEAQAEAAGELLAALEAVLGSYEEMNPEARELFENIRDAGDEAAALAGAAEGVAGPISAAADEAARLAEKLGISLELAQKYYAAGGRATEGPVIHDPRDPRYDPVAARDARLRDGMERLSAGAGTVSPFDPSRQSTGSTSTASGSRGGGSSGSNSNLREAAQWISKVQTATEKYRGELEDLQRLQSKGHLTNEEYARSVEMVTDQFNRSEFAEVYDAIDGVSDAIAQNIDDWDGMRDAIGGILSGIASDILSSGIRSALESVLMPSTPGISSGGGILTSLLGGLLSFDGGGYTGAGARSGGTDGRGGFPAILHPNETVVDHTKAQSSGGAGAAGEIGVSVSVDDDGKVQAYVRRMGVQAARQGSTAAVREVKNNWGGYSNQFNQNGAVT